MRSAVKQTRIARGLYQLLGGEGPRPEMDNFQVDVILHSLQDLKQVRDKNEKQLAQECARRMALESRLESLTSRHSEAGVRKTAAVESLKVASEQASLAEAQANSLEQRCKEKREEIRVLSEKMEELKREEEAALSEFSEKMTQLADKFRAARAYYTEPQLTSEVEDCDKETEGLKERVLTKKATLAQLTSTLSQLQQHGEEEGRDGEKVTRENWKIFLDIMTEGRDVARAELGREEQTLRSLQLPNKSLTHAQPMTEVTREE